MRRTKIVCTIGPASESEDVLQKLIGAGMNVARLNFSHGSHASHARVIRRIRSIARRSGRTVAILQDLPGPKIRIGRIEGDRVELQTGQTFILTARPVPGNDQMVSVSHKTFARAVQPGDPILIGDGEIELEAVKRDKDSVICKVILGGVLSSNKGIHFPRGKLDLPSLTAQDKRDLAFSIEQKVDLVALSFVRNSRDVLQARRELHRRNASIPLIAKIEKHEALDQIDAILEAVDGIMVARGDLGLEIPLEKVPAFQKMIIRKANFLGKPVITATQMVRSMVHNPRPTRAEVTDIATAVLDGTDALMLSEESAVGNYPVQAVQTLAKVAAETEKILEPRPRFDRPGGSVPEAISYAAVALARDLGVKAFLIPTTSGSTARLIARYRSWQPIIAVSPIAQTTRSLCLVSGVYPVKVGAFQSTETMLKLVQEKALKTGLVKKGDLVAVTAGLPLHQPGTTNMITVKAID